MFILGRLLLPLGFLGSYCIANFCEAILCYKCDSTIDAGCQEKFDSRTAGLESVNCSDQIYQAKYCIKTTGMYGGKPGTRRFCTSKNLGNMCNYLQRPNEPLEYRACIYTCTADLCNGQDVIIPSIFIMFLIIFTLVIKLAV